MRHVLLVFLTLFLTTAAFTQKSIVGTWKAIDSGDGAVKYHIQIEAFQGRYYGKIVKLVNMPSDQRCGLCPSELKDAPILGMQTIEKLQLVNGFYKNGRMLDPRNGRWYTAQMWLKEEDPDVLVVRGFLGFIYFTEYWHRME